MLAVLGRDSTSLIPPSAVAFVAVSAWCTRGVGQSSPSSSIVRGGMLGKELRRRLVAAMNSISGGMNSRVASNACKVILGVPIKLASCRRCLSYCGQCKRKRMTVSRRWHLGQLGLSAFWMRCRWLLRCTYLIS